MTHKEYCDNVKVATPCTALHITFGGRCLNCGYQPETKLVHTPAQRGVFCNDCGQELIDKFSTGVFFHANKCTRV